MSIYFTWNFLTKRMVIYVIVFYEKKKMFEGVRFSWEKGLNNLYLFSIQHCLLSNDPPFSVHISMVDEFSRIYQRISSSRPTFNHVQLLDTFGFISLLRFFDCFLSANAGNQIKKYTHGTEITCHSFLGGLDTTTSNNRCSYYGSK